MPNSQKYGRGQVIEIINSVITKIDTTHANRDVFAHIAELAEIIDALRKDITAHSPQHVKNSHVPDATDELGEVVRATADATHKIMSICEEIETFAGGLEADQHEALSAKVTQIYEACTFQDVTGQRIKNVVTTLQLIEEKVDRIMDTLGDKVGLKVGEGKYEKEVSIDDAKSLMNGPQMADKAISQDEIDRLLAEFDNPAG